MYADPKKVSTSYQLYSAFTKVTPLNTLSPFHLSSAARHAINLRAMEFINLLVLLICGCLSCVNCFLRPCNSESREIFPFDGIWNFKLAPMSDPELGMKEKWWKKPRLGGVRNIKLIQPSLYDTFKIISCAGCNYDACSE